MSLWSHPTKHSHRLGQGAFLGFKVNLSPLKSHQLNLIFPPTGLVDSLLGIDEMHPWELRVSVLLEPEKIKKFC